MERDFKVNNLQAEEIMMNAGFKPVSCYVIREHKYNHLFNIRYNQFNFFVKAHTKDVYTDEEVKAGTPVKHEVVALKMLADSGLKTPRVVTSSADLENPIQYPFMLTQRLEGEPLLDVLNRVDRKDFNTILMLVGEYVRQMHDIKLSKYGYEGIDGKINYNHRGWDLKQRKQEALAMLEAERDELSQPMYLGLREKFNLMDADLAPSYAENSFIHGNLLPNKFYIKKHGNEWSITGLLDLEMAGAGDSVEDILTFAVGISSEFPDSFWWEPFFKGYGLEPKFERFKLRMLGLTEKQLGWKIGYREEVLSSILAAVHWRFLFRIKTAKFAPKVKENSEDF